MTAAPSPALMKAAASSLVAGTTPPVVPASSSSIPASLDADGDALMLATDVTRLVAGMRQQDLPTQMQNLSALSQLEGAATTSAAVAASAAVLKAAAEKASLMAPSQTASSLSPKLDNSTSPPTSGSGGSRGASNNNTAPHGRHRGAPPSSSNHGVHAAGGSLPPAPIPHTGSLSLPASQVHLHGVTSASKDIFGSPPPLEAAPLIDIYSPRLRAHLLGADLSPSQSQAPSAAAPNGQVADAADAGNDAQPMQIDPPPARVSLAQEVAALNRRAEAPSSPAVAAGLLPIPVVSSASPSAPSSSPPSQTAPSQCDAASAYVSLMTQGSVAAPAPALPVAMPSMTGVIAVAANPHPAVLVTPAAVAAAEPQSPSQRTAAVVSAPVTPAATPTGLRAPTTPAASQQTAVTDAIFSPVRALSSASGVSTSAVTAVVAPAAAAAAVSSQPTATSSVAPAGPNAEPPLQQPALPAAPAAATVDPMNVVTQPNANGDSPLISVQPELPVRSTCARCSFSPLFHFA
jgi:hypothetical protein